MSVPICVCRIKYDLADSVFPAKTEYCPLHKQAGELFEVLDAIMGQTEQVTHHDKCHCIGCRGMKALYKARGMSAPMARSAIAGVGVPAGATKGK